MTESEEFEFLKLERERSQFYSQQSLADRASGIAKKVVSFPLTNPLSLKMQSAGENVRGAVTSIGERMMGKATSIGSGVGLGVPQMALGSAGALIKAAGEFGELSPINLSLLAGGEFGGRVGAGMAGDMAKSTGSYLAKKGISAFLGPSEKATTAALLDPSILSASVEDLTRGMPKIADKFDSVISNMHYEAGKKLSTSSFIQAAGDDPGGALTKEEVISAIDKARTRLGGIYTDEDRTAASTLNRIKKSLAKIRNTVSQNQVHDLVTKLDAEIPWPRVYKTPQDLTATDKALINVRTKLDSILKIKNTDYAKAMKPVEEAIQGRNEFVDKFALKKVKGLGYVPEDQAFNKVRSALNEGKLDTQRVLKRTEEIIGENLYPEIEKARFGDEFTGGITQGSRKVNAWAGLGAGAGVAAGTPLGIPGLGGMVGGAGGAATGAYMDKVGGEVAGNLIRQYLDILPKFKKGVGRPLRAARKFPVFSPIAIGARRWADENP